MLLNASKKSLIFFAMATRLLCVPVFCEQSIANFAPYNLSAEQVGKLSKLAIEGDKEACLRVASFYTVNRGEFLTAALWYKLLADKGDVDGIYGYGASLQLAGKYNEAKKWLLLAKAKGHPYADGALKELENLREEHDEPKKQRP